MASLSNPQPKLNVFLSVDEDIRCGFASHVNADLVEASIETFIDKKIVDNEEIPPDRLKAIEESVISVVIFSLNYASSSWCLHELVKILECRDTKTLIVLPVFYHIDPLDVGNQSGIFGEKFVELKGRDKYKEEIELHQEWEKALRDIAKISGWHLDRKTDEADIRREIVKHVFRVLSYMYPRDEKHLVGVQSRTRKIESLLHIGLNNIVLRVGIWGMCGIGKTTIAKAVFNKNFREFDEYFFVENVSEELESCNGVSTHLQQNLISAILKDQNVDINSELTKQRLGLKKVLIVFDDVNCQGQIEKLIGDLDYFGLGSRIIITAKDRQMLTNYKVDGRNIYKVKGLSHHEALQVFSWFAFHKRYPISGYHTLSDKVVKYAKGLPFALKVWGEALFTREDVNMPFSKEEIWRSAIKKLRRELPKEIQDELMVSYKELDIDQRNVFLDIAFFLKWESRDVVITFLDVGGYRAAIDIITLINRCLISVSNNKIIMHDLFQQLGREIIQETSKNPEKCSRLQNHEDIHPILEESMGTIAIEGICFDMSEVSKMKLSDPYVFKKMQNLRFLKIYNSYCEKDKISKIDVPEGLKSVFSKLRYLCWHGIPLSPLQLKFNPHNLVVLEMPYVTVEQLWTDALNLVNLKRINLSHSKNLLRIPDLSLVNNLESLILEGCTSLSEVSSSIQGLKNLVILNLRCCTSLSSVCIHAQSLREVILSYCSKLKMLTFPVISSKIEELFLEDTAIEQLPSSIENLSRLVILNLKNCSRLESLPIGICKLMSLQHLNLSGCSKLDGLVEGLGDLEALKVQKTERLVGGIPSSNVCLHFFMELDLTDCHITELPSTLSQLSSLKRLLLGKNNFERIPASIIRLSKLSYLELSYCERLQSLSTLPCRLQYLDAHNCTSLEAPSFSSIIFRTILRKARINFINCSKLGQTRELGDAMKDALLKIERLQDFKEFYPRPSACICFPGSEIPDWFKFKSLMPSTLEVQPFSIDSDFVNFAMCAVVEFQNYRNTGQGLVVGYDCNLKSNNDTLVSYHGTLRGLYYGTGPDEINSDHVFIGYEFHMHPSGCYSQMIIQFYVEDLNGNRIDCCNVKKCGLHLLYKETNERETNHTSRG